MEQNASLDIRVVPVEEIVPVRHSVLRVGQPRETCYYKNDNDEGAFHLAVYADGTPVTIGSFHLEQFPAFPRTGPTYKLRGMGTVSEYRGRGYARALVLRAEELMRERGCVGWWCHARVVAFGFYESMGLSFYGDLFEEEGVGPHKVMLRPFSESEA